MEKFKNWWKKTWSTVKGWFVRTFTGIYGIDNLYFVLFGFALFIALLNAFVHFWGLWLIGAATLGYMIYRALSHNIAVRRQENAAFFTFIKKIKRFFKLNKNRIRDRKTHVYKKCPKCKAVLRLPKAKGEHTAVCPKCSERFKVK